MIDDETQARSTAGCYADELIRQIDDYGTYDPQGSPHDAYAVDALRAGAAALRAQGDVEAATRKAIQEAYLTWFEWKGGLKDDSFTHSDGVKFQQMLLALEQRLLSALKGQA